MYIYIITSVIATPFKSIINDINDNQPSTKSDIKNIHCQNNYSNQILSTIASQLDRIENTHPSKDPPSFFPREGGVPSKPLFQPFEFPTSTKITLNPQKQLLEQIQSKLDNLTLQEKQKSKTINVLNQNSDSEETESIIETDKEIQILESQFQNLGLDESTSINKIRHERLTTQRPKTKNYYPRPTPPDIQYEENYQMTGSRYDGDAIYEWNLDGLSEYQILNFL